MKIKSLFVPAATLLLLCTTGCTGSPNANSDSENSTCEFETYSFSHIAETTDSFMNDYSIAGAKYCTLMGQGVLPVKIGNNDISALRDTLTKVAEIEFPSSGVVAPKLSEGWKLTNLSDTTTTCNEKTVTLFIILNTPQAIVWKAFNSEYNCGAAHGMYGSLYINYSLETHKILDLKDLMIPRFENRLRDMIVDKLRHNPDLQATEEEINIPSEWYLTTSGITFVYSVYEIAPFSSGEIEVALNVYEFEELLSPTGKKLFNIN